MRQCFTTGLFMMIYAFGYTQCPGFYDGFENDTCSPEWIVDAEVYYLEVVDSNPAVGDYCLRMASNGLDKGMNLYPAPSSPNEISWWIYPKTPSFAGTISCGLVLGDSAMTPSSGQIVSIAAFDNVLTVFGDGTLLDYPITFNTWYHIELRDINWTTHSYDLYINDTLEGAGFLFADITQGNVGRVLLASYPGITGIWDEISIGPLPLDINVNTTNPTTCGGNGAIDATITNGNPGYTYSWSNGATTQDLALVPEGSYTLVVTDSAGCTDTATAVLNDPSAPAVTLHLPEDTVCINAPAFNLSGASIPGGTYSGTGVSANMFTPSVAGAGSKTITYTYTAPNNCISTAQDQLVVNTCLGLEDEAFTKINIYPNPASSYIMIEPLTGMENFRLSLLNPMGQVIQEQWMTGGNMMFNIETYPAGVYFLQWTNGEKQVTKKIIIQ